MPAEKASARPRTRKAGRANTDIATPDDARLTTAVALFIAGPAAAALSFQPLFSLAEFAAWPVWLAWLLPITLDVYAGCSILFGHQLPDGHRATGAARRNAVGALSLTMICNVLHHALAENMIGRRFVWLVVVGVSVLPPIIVERLLALRMLASNGNRKPVADPVAPRVPATGSRNPATAPDATPARGAATQRAELPSARATTDRAAADNPAPTADTPRTARLIPRDEQLRVTRDLVREHGRDVPLKVISEALGGKDKSGASRLRSAIWAEMDAAEEAPGEPDGEPERAEDAV